MKEFLKRRNKDILVVAVLLGSMAMTYLRYKTALIRAVTGIKDLAISVAYYFCQIFGKEITVTVTAHPDLDVLKYLPYDVDELFRKLSDMWEYVFDIDCFMAYIIELLVSFNDISIFVSLQTA